MTPSAKVSMTGCLLLLAIAVSGCSAGIEVGNDETLDAEEVETRIQSGLEEQAGREPAIVSCPRDVPAEEGTTFECTGVGPKGVWFRIDVAVTDNSGSFSYVVPKRQGARKRR